MKSRFYKSTIGDINGITSVTSSKYTSYRKDMMMQLFYVLLRAA